ncbi:cell cycle checkpoint protein RAD17-like isoform X1 [Asterias amurensis]|uniref:cell cycle checkpoint protein RAD17-like isoform X1 n=1 Tax=Asterias amurensis TaxID=7602 RepID=UPI003AB7C16A
MAKSSQLSQRQQWVSPSFDNFDNAPHVSRPTKHLSKSMSNKKAEDTLPQLLGRKRSRNDENPGRIRTTDKDKYRKSVDIETWVDKHAPQIQTDLAVHKKKIAEVEEWLKRHIQQRQRSSGQKAPILVLTGPAGAGKTATIHVLAKELHAEVQQWSNPDVASFDVERFRQDRQDFNLLGGSVSQSQTALFQDFLTRANRYPALQLFGSAVSSQKVCLVEDIPNAFYRDPQSFHNVLRKFTVTGRSPLVFIISDTHGGESSAYKLFPKDLQSNLGFESISFNPVALTSMVKVMTRIATTESNRGRRRFPVPCKTTIEALANASAGDVRSAINTLQFACLKDTHDLEQALAANPPKSSTAKSRKQPVGKSGRQTKEKKVTKDSSLAAIGGRDTSMFLFRALGKILYCKREPKGPEDPVLPAHLAHHDRDRLKVNPEAVLEQTHMSSDNFNLYLHQNYLDFYENVEDVVHVSQYFSDSDFLSCEWRSRSAMTTYGASLASRALIHCNTARSRCSCTSSVGWKPLHKPQWFDTSKKYREGCLSAKGLFVGQCWTPVELQTQLLPYLAIISVPLKNPGQINFLQEVTRFTRYKQTWRHRPEKLDEKDEIEDEADEDVPSSQGVRMLPQRGPHITAESVDPLSKVASTEDEIVIEDFDD